MHSEIIVEQKKLLQIHRQTLAHYLQQRAQLGSSYIPPGIAHGINEARDNIRHIKKTLRSWGIDVEDQPNDEEPPPLPDPKPDPRAIFMAIKSFREIEQIAIEMTIIINTWSKELDTAINRIKSQHVQNSSNRKDKIQAILDNLSIHLNKCTDMIGGINNNYGDVIKRADTGLWSLLKNQDLSKRDNKEQVVTFLSNLDSLEMSLVNTTNLINEQRTALLGVPRVNQNLNNATDNYLDVMRRFADNVSLSIEVIWRARGVMEGLLKSQKQ